MPRILLVEDNEMNRDMLSRRLQRRGYDVVMAMDGEAAITMAASEQPDLILMDLDLPILDGWEATCRLKREPETSSIPVIALTSHVMISERDKAIEAGCDDYEAKPIEFERLLRKVQVLLKQQDKP
jgi:CheY-like chemotaxis protein